MIKLLLVISTLCATLLLTAAQWEGSEQDSRSKSFTVGKGGTVEVEVAGGDIRLVPWEKNEVHVRADGIDRDNVDRLKMEQFGNTVRIEYKPRRSRGWGRGDNVRFEVSLPAEFNAELRTSGGDIDIRSGLTGRVKGSTSGGDIKLADVGGTIDLATSGGDIVVGNVKGDVSLKTSGGDIRIGVVSGEATVGTSGGDVKVESVGKRLKASTSGGDIHIGDVGGEATASTAGGDVRVGKVSGRASLSTAGGDIELRGASGEVTAKTAGGDIRLENITGSIEAKTAGGDIRSELIPSGTGRSTLKTAGGDVVLHIPESAKATIEATIRIEGRWGRSREKYEVRSDFKADSYKVEEGDEIRATYTLNGGGEVITLETVNSNIEIRKMKK
jgi:DUF4097 and DUF4098 domain-containing protein YvlB